ncbi:MAG: hypothetical protein AB7T19_08685 [Planctomycetota bacterium]
MKDRDDVFETEFVPVDDVLLADVAVKPVDLAELALARTIRERLLRSPQVAPDGVATSAPPWQRS